ncbi:hypothetical protein KI387_028702, partial [Taxus chinensis]
RSALVKKKREALAVEKHPHKERLDELGNLIAQKMDLIERRMFGMANIVLVLQNEKGEMNQDELESISTDIPEKTCNVLNDWQALEDELKEEYLDLILPVEEK